MFSMRQSCVSVLLAVLALALFLGTAYSLTPDLDIITLGGFTISGEVQKVTFINGDFLSLQGQDAFGVEGRLSSLWCDSFLAVSYKAGGFCDLGESQDFGFSLHSHFLEVSAGKNLRLGTGILSLGAGYAYVIDEFSVLPEGRPRTEHEERDSGCVLGARFSVPVTSSISVLWDYEVLIRPSTDYAGRLNGGWPYNLVQGSMHHFILGGISVRVF
jgi:hypothetical protein